MRLRTGVLALGLLGSAALVFLVVAWLSRPDTSKSIGDGEATAEDGERSFRQDGFAVEMDVRPLRGSANPGDPLRAWESFELRFSVSEAREGGQAMRGLTPLAWLVRRKHGEARPDRETCKREIKSLLAGRLARSADVNLNEYYLVTLDENNSLSVIDPQIESAKTKTLGMVSFPSYGSDFVLAPNRRDVLVTLPDSGQVAAADVNRLKSRYLNLGGQPWSIELQPDGRYAWVGHRGEAKVDVIDTETFALQGEVEVGPGPQRMAFAADSRTAYVVSPNSPRLDVIDVDRLQRTGALPVGEGAIDVAYSELSRQVLVLQERGAILTFDADDPALNAQIEVPPEPTAFGIAPDARYGFVLYRDRDEIVLFDTATQRTTHTVSTQAGPEAIDFTGTFAYIRHAGSELVLMIDLTALTREAKVVTSIVSLGQRPPGQGRPDVPAPMMAPLPEGGGALVLSSSDQSIYHFMEGMNAPMGAYRTYPYRARGLLIVDRTIHEIEPGLYATDFQAPEPGHYTVPFLLPASPQLYGCFSLELVGPPKKPELWKSLRVDLEGRERIVSAGEPSRFSIRLLDATSGAPVQDIEDLAV
ncbi:MAG: YncE family protein, partial [Planctomycetota bacterium]